MRLVLHSTARTDSANPGRLVGTGNAATSRTKRDHRLLNGRSGMSAEMALRVEKAFGVSMDMLLRMQAWYDASQMRARAREIAVEPYQSA